jgi:hypothetical protein
MLPMVFAIVACGGGRAQITDGGGTDAGSGGVNGGGGGVPANGGAGGQGGEEGPDQCDPGQLPVETLALWLAQYDAISATDGRVALWLDHSFNDNNAVPSDQSRRPKLFTFPAINGKGAVRFGPEPTSLRIEDADTLHFGTDDFAILMLAAYRGSGPDGLLFGKQDPASAAPGMAMLTNHSLSAGNPVAFEIAHQAGYFAAGSVANLADGSFRLYAGIRIGKTIQLKINGVAVAVQETPTVVDVSALGLPAWLGVADTQPQAQPLDGDIAEVVIIRGPYVARYLKCLERYFAFGYGL